MKQYVLRIRKNDRDIFFQLANGSKSVETRASTPKNQTIVVGDTIKFTCGKDSVTKTVQSIEHFDSIETMLKDIPLAKILPTVQTIDEAKKVYFSFPGYREKIEQHGIIAFGLSE